MLSYVAMVPERKLGVVVLTNVSGHNALYTALGTRILEAFLGAPTRDVSALALAQVNKGEAAAAERARKRMAERVQNTKPSRPIEEYAGTFRSDMYGDLTVTLEEGSLVLRYPTATVFQLHHFTYDAFLGTPLGGSAILPDASVVRFELDAMGKVATVDVDGIGEFTRVKK